MGAITEPARNPITGVQERLLDAACEMFDIERGKVAALQLTYLNPILAQTSLPYTDPLDAPFYKCENGNVATTVLRGTLQNPYTKKVELMGYPYGAKPRLILMYLCTRVTLTGQKEVYLGDNMKDFMQRIGIKQQTGGANGSIRPTKQQLMRLTASRLQLFCNDGYRYSMLHASPVIRKFDFWLPDELHEAGMWEGMITLGDEVYRCLMEGNMPLRTEAIRGLQNSPMALDVYSWLAFRLWRIKHSPMKPLPWSVLHAQFGAGYQNIRHFRAAFKEVLASVKAVYPEAKFEFNSDGELVLRRSKPPVPQKVQMVVQSVLPFPVKN